MKLTRKSAVSRRRPRLRVPALIGTVAATLATLLVPGSVASAAERPALVTPLATLDAALYCPASFTHPGHEPVLLVHGTGVDDDQSWSWGYTPALQADGYDVCMVELPEKSMVDMQTSAEYVVHAIDKIYAQSGRKVDVIGHSQGGLLPRWAVKWWSDLQTKVDDLITLGGPNHGIGGGNLLCVGPCSAPAFQMGIGSNFLAALNRDDETPGAISYTSLYTYGDELDQPWTTAPLTGATNIAIQDVCPGRVVTHGGLLYDSVTFQLVEDALSHAGTADAGRLPFGKCLGVYLPGVTSAEASYVSTVFATDAAATIASAPVLTSEPPLRPYAL